MKNLVMLTFFAVFLLLGGCGNYLDSHYTVVLPSVPRTWIALLGEPHWRVQWFTPDGAVQKRDISPGENLTVNIPVTWINPVTAWPWWPQAAGMDHLQSKWSDGSGTNLPPGLFKPAGALFPFDVSGGKINLSWDAGHDTVFYLELTLANSGNETRLPANFDWMRFRELFSDGTLNEDVCKDPWLVDWKYAAERTIASGFDRRRLTAETSALLTVPAGRGPWYGSSPFAEPLTFSEEETPVFPIRSGINTWISDKGILRVSENTWILTEIMR